MGEFLEKTWAEIVAMHNGPILAEIDYWSSQVEATQQLYDSLLEFKGKVDNYHLDFIGVSESKKTKLNDLDTTVKNNDAKRLYMVGMADTFKDMVDNRIPPSVFDWFINMIETKLSSYASDISSMESKISSLRNSLW